jgi:hypothetical protein
MLWALRQLTPQERMVFDMKHFQGMKLRAVAEILNISEFETLAKEVGPLGVKVTIVEPGGFRTDFAGSSTELREGRPEYDATVGKTARFQRDYDGKQPGDPAIAAAALLKLASVDEPPLRIVLGIDAFNAAEANDLAKIELGRKWKDLSYATDFVKTDV